MTARIAYGERVRITIDAVARYHSEDGRDLEYEYPTELGPHEGRLALDSDAITVRRLTLDDDPISSLSFGARVYNALMYAGHCTVGELVKQTGHDLLDIRNFGNTSLAEVIDKLDEHELKLQEPPCPLPDLPTRASQDGHR